MLAPAHGLVDRLAILIADAVAGNRRRAALALLVCAVLAAGGLALGRSLRVDTNLEALLADNAPSVVALAELRARQGSTDLLNIAVKSSDPAANRRLVEDIHAAVQTWPETVDCSIDRDFTTIRDHALYYLSVDDLAKLRDRLKREKQRAIAGKVGLGSGEFDPRAVVDDDWDADPDVAELEQAPPPKPSDAGEAAEGDSVDEILAEQRAKLESDGRISRRDLDVIWPAENERGEIEWKPQVGRPIASSDGEVMLVQVRLTRPATDLAFATDVGERVDELLARLDPKRYAPDMLAKIGGAYATSGEARAIIRDLKWATWVSAITVVVMIVVSYRTVRSIFIILVPLAVAMLTALGVAELVLDELNVLTAFLFAVLTGIGVDFAVHIYTQREQQGEVADWHAVLRKHLRPLGSSMLTTFGSFLVLMLADFEGFQEFGLIAALGVLLAFVVALVVVPALDVVIGPLRGAKASTDGSGGPARGPYRGRWWRLALLAGMLVVGVLGLPHVRFEKDMRELRAPRSEAEAGIGYKRALADTESTGTAVVMLADSQEQLQIAIDALEQRRSEGETVPGTDKVWIKDIVALQTHMPADQAAKREILREIATIADGFLAELPDLPHGDKARGYATHLDALVRLGRAESLAPDDLPEWAKRLFREQDGSMGKIALAYTDLQEHDLDQVTWVTARFRETVQESGVRSASTRFILGDLTVEVERDARRLPPIALALIALLLFLDVRTLSGTAVAFASLSLGLVLTSGTMGLLPIHINFYNLVVMPAVVGLGIDSSIHLWYARRHGMMWATNKAALVSALTTAGAFAGLLVAEHRGLRSIGLLGCVAILGCVVAAVLALGWPRRR